MRVEVILEDERVFEPGRTVAVTSGQSRESRQIEFSRRQHGRLIVKLQGIDTIDEAERLVGAYLEILEQELPPADEGTFYTFRLKGCRVTGADGEVLGRVTDVLDHGGSQLLQVEGSSGEILIPFAEEYLKRIDLQNGQIEVELPDELRDLNK